MNFFSAAIECGLLQIDQSGASHGPQDLLEFVSLQTLPCSYFQMKLAGGAAVGVSQFGQDVARHLLLLCSSRTEALRLACFR